MEDSEQSALWVCPTESGLVDYLGTDNLVTIVNFYDELPKKTSDFAVCVIPFNESEMELLDVSGDSIKSYAKKCGADYIELSGDQSFNGEWPIGNKFRLHQVTSVYKKTVFFDCDVIVKRNAPDLFETTPDDEISAYDEYHDWKDKEWITRQYQTINKFFGKPFDYNIPRFMINSGVMVIPNSCCEYYKQPTEPYPTIYCFDQQHLSMRLPDRKFFQLGRRWNNSFATIDFWDYIEESHVQHINDSRPISQDEFCNRLDLMRYLSNTKNPTEYDCKTRHIDLPDSYIIPDNMDEVEIITYHYNLTQSKNLTRTYKIWIESLKNIAPYIKCYEVVFDDREPEIDGSIVIPADSKRNCMWQKESLMNLSIKNIPDHKKYFLWIDHDQCYADSNWLNQCIEKINNGFDFVQLFKINHYLGKTFNITESSHSRAYVCHDQPVMGSRNVRGAPGLGWACNIESLKKISPLPNTIVGSGDEYLAAGVLRQPDWLRVLEWSFGKGNLNWPKSIKDNLEKDRLDRMNVVAKHNIMKHVDETMRKYFNTSYCDADSFHLWHGDVCNRQYHTRYSIIEECDISIDEDIFVNENGLLEFKEHKLDASERLYKFFLDRKEDD